MKPNPTARSSSDKGQLVIISGPSGVGKSTVVSQLIEKCDLPLELSVSATTRQPRKGEVHGVNYYFISDSEFQEKLQNEEFLEAFEVFGRDWYGTLKQTVTNGLESGKWLILEIDVQGALKVLEQFPETITVFVHPGSLEELERRLKGRKTESTESLNRRLDVARQELAVADKYQHIVINETVEQAVNEICQLLIRSGEKPECTTN